MAAHRYWRLNITRNNNSYIEIAEIEFREVAGVPQTPSGGTITSSSQWSGTYSRNYAFDSDVNTRWLSSSSATTGWIAYDYGAGNEKDIVEFAITSYGTTNTPRDFIVEYSDDGINWISDYVEIVDQTGWSNREQRVFALEIPQPQPIRATQIPILTVDLVENVPIHITQIPFYFITLPVQPARITQVPLQTPYIPRPVPLPMPLVPETPVNEVWQWRTITTRTHRGHEQRTLLRDEPRYQMRFAFLWFDEAERRALFDMLWKYQDGVFTYPLFQYSAPVTRGVNAGAVHIPFDVTRTDVRAGDVLAIYSPLDLSTRYVNASLVYPDGADLVTPLDFDIDGGCYICAAIPMRMLSSVGMGTQTITGDGNTQLESVEPRALQRIDGGHLLTRYDNKIILDRRIKDGTSDSFSRNTEVVDTTYGIPYIDTKWRSMHAEGRKEFVYDRFTDSDYWRAFVDEVKGGQKSFLLPTYFDDLPLAETPVSGASTLVSSNIQAHEYFRTRMYNHVRIERANGTVIYRRVNDVRILYTSEGYPVAIRMHLDASIGTGANAIAISKISFAPLTRIADDAVAIVHESTSSTITLNCRTVNQ